MTVAVIQESVLQLSPAEKAALIDFLWESLDREKLREIESRWGIEAEERIDAFERGELLAAEGPEALQKLRHSLRK